MSRIKPLAVNTINEDYVWDDIIQPVMGKLLDSSSGKLDPDWINKGIKIADSTLITNDTHKLHWGYQIYHKIKLNGKCNPHVHWIQTSEDVPNFWMQYRFWQNGKDAHVFTQLPLDQLVFPYTPGTRILQISYIPQMIDFSLADSGNGLKVSDFMDVEFTRDTNNTSGLFSGADPLVGNVTIKGFDPHIQINSAGSRKELEK